MHQDRFTNIPFVIAKFLVYAIGFRSRSGLCVGQYITRLANSLDSLIPRVVSSLTLVGQMDFIERNQLKGMKVIDKGPRNGTYQLNAHSMEPEDEEMRDHEHTDDEGASGSRQQSGSQQPLPQWDPYTTY